MNKDEFLRMIKEHSEEIELYREALSSFNEKMPIALIDLTMEHMPVLRENRSKFEDELSDIAKGASIQILECYNYVVSKAYNGEEVTYRKPPKIPTKLESLEKLNKELKNVPEDGKSYYAEIFWNDIVEQNKHLEHKNKVFNKTKEILVDHFLDNIIDLEGTYLRKLDADLYLTLSVYFWEDLYDLEYEIQQFI